MIVKIIQKVDSSVVVSFPNEFGMQIARVIPRDTIKAGQQIKIGAVVELHITREDIAEYPQYGVILPMKIMDEYELGQLFARAGIWTLEDYQKPEALDIFVSHMRNLYIDAVTVLRTQLSLEDI